MLSRCWSWLWANYWPLWLSITALTFIVKEGVALFNSKPGDTLSEWIWQKETLLPGQSFMQWTFIHLLITSVLGLTFFWLFFHFGWGLFRGGVG